MAKKKERRWTRKRLLALGVPAVLIPGILIAMALGWKSMRFGLASAERDVKRPNRV